MDPRRPRAGGGRAVRGHDRPRVPDPVAAALPRRPAQSPFGSTIAHGLYTLSLSPRFTYEAYAVEGFAFGVNYGYDRVRFPAPLPVDSRVRMRATLESVDDVPGGIQMKVTQTFEREGGDKPVCVAEQLVRLYTGG